MYHNLQVTQAGFKGLILAVHAAADQTFMALTTCRQLGGNAFTPLVKSRAEDVENVAAAMIDLGLTDSGNKLLNRLYEMLPEMKPVEDNDILTCLLR